LTKYCKDSKNACLNKNLRRFQLMGTVDHNQKIHLLLMLNFNSNVPMSSVVEELELLELVKRQMSTLVKRKEPHLTLLLR